MKAKLFYLIICPILALFIGCATTSELNITKTINLIAPDRYENSYGSSWDVINSTIRNTNAEIIVIQWAGYGGYTYLGDETISAIEQAKRAGKTVIFRLTGQGISMHANVACHASKIEWNNNFLVFHSGFTGHNKEGRKIYSSDRSYFDYCVAQGPLVGIMTQEDITNIIVNRERVEISPDHHVTLPDYP